MPDVIGNINDPKHDAFVSDIMAAEDAMRLALEDPFMEITEYWKLFLARLEDERLPDEDWRANVHVPYPYSGVETVGSSMVDIMLSSDPPIQVTRVHETEKEFARALEFLYDHVLSMSRWPLTLDMTFRELLVQGSAAMKVVQVNRTSKVNLRASQKDEEVFKASVVEAVKNGAPPAPQEPALFERWRTDINLTNKFNVIIPSTPVTGPRTIRRYTGPSIVRIPIWDLRFDPTIEDWHSQPYVAHRLLRTQDWVKSRAGTDPTFPFDPKQVDDCLEGWDGEEISTWQKEVATMMGIEYEKKSSPLTQNLVELLEVYQIDKQETPFAMVLNRKGVINKSMQHPFSHAGLPVHLLRNVPIPFQAMGMSEYQQTKSLYIEIDTLRNLRIDAIMLAVLPVFLKAKSVGLPGLTQLLRPGLVMESDNPKGINKLIDMNIPSEVFREESEGKRDVDETHATESAMRGASATVGRVSATESERRYGRALVRTKGRIVRIETEMDEIPPQIAFLFHQFGDPADIAKITGAAGVIKQFPREKFLDALEMGVRFRGASKALNRDMQAQKLKDFLVTMGSQLNKLSLEEVRNVARRWLESMGEKEAAVILSDATTQQMLEAEKAAAKDAQRLAADQSGRGPNQPPEVVGPEGRAALEGQG